MILSKIIRNINDSTAHYVRFISSFESAIVNNTIIPKDSDNTNKSILNNQTTLVPKVSFLHHPYSLKEIPIDFNVKTTPDKLFAIILVKGSQHKVTIDDVIVVDKMENVDIGQIIKIDQVLMIGSQKGTLLGHPCISGAEVTGEIEEITKDRKVYIFKFRRRKNSKRLRGFRRSIVTIRINSIIPGNNHKEFSENL